MTNNNYCFLSLQSECAKTMETTAITETTTTPTPIAMMTSDVVIPFKKRKINLIEDDDDDVETVVNENKPINIILPGTENVHRKKCAKLEEGLAIKYNKLIYNWEKILQFKRFRKYFVFFDLFSKRHLINHSYRLDLLKILNCYDFTPYSHKTCTCKTQLSYSGFLVCFNESFMHRKKYSNHREDKSEYMTKLYEKHSILHEDNNFFDNRINTVFLQRIQNFEVLHSVDGLDRKTTRLLQKNMLKTKTLHTLTAMKVCRKCRNIETTDFETWNIVCFEKTTSLDMQNLHTAVLKLDNNYIVPVDNENNSCLENTTICVVYKTTQSNMVFIYKGIFYVLNSQNMFILFDLDVFRKVNFFCNFNFYFANISNTLSSSTSTIPNVIEINKL